jgi:riboflavin kinase/FMN adenylyltransferase
MDRVRIERLSPLGWPSPAVTIGNFDGVHLGHQALVAAAVERARAGGGVVVVLTFDPHPARVVSPDRAPAALSTPAQKEELLAGLGVEPPGRSPLRRQVAGLDPGVRPTGARGDARGPSRRGRGDVPVRPPARGDARASPSSRSASGRRARDFPVVAEGEPISSSRVRDALARGDVHSARALLGRPYFVDAVVVRGDGRGRAIGVPTANLEPENEVLPAPGVYAARCLVPGRRWSGAAVNLGHRPTFGGGPTTLEAHLLDFEGDLYGARVRLEFHGRVRGEQRFDGAEALVARIRQDVAEARALLSAAGDERV